MLGFCVVDWVGRRLSVIERSSEFAFITPDKEVTVLLSCRCLSVSTMTQTVDDEFFLMNLLEMVMGCFAIATNKFIFTAQRYA